jgi:DNA-binding beta-propeller fold protein YncE
VLGAASCVHPTRMLGSTTLSWGRHGQRDGEFHFPRAIGVNGPEVFVVDRSGRVQVFSLEGKFLRKWSTPSYENGTPTGICFTAANEVVIPDTHYSRILIYSLDGKLLRQWGEYGSSPDQFIYPTDVALDSSGNFYFSEYGQDADRVHVFDATGKFLRQWGSFGDSPGQFNRAMGIALGVDSTILVADTANHRIQRFDEHGKLLGIVGGPGREPGKLNFPHYLASLKDGSFLVCEYGNNRISRLDPAGKPIATFGSPGRDPGEFAAPRGVAVTDTSVFVADTDNHRIQCFGLEALT